MKNSNLYLWRSNIASRCTVHIKILRDSSIPNFKNAVTLKIGPLPSDAIGRRRVPRRTKQTPPLIFCHDFSADSASGRSLGSTAVIPWIRGNKKSTLENFWGSISTLDHAVVERLTAQSCFRNKFPIIKMSTLKGSYGTVRESSGTSRSMPRFPSASLGYTSDGIRTDIPKST